MTESLVQNSIVLCAFIFLAIVFLGKKQNEKLNWAIFYSSLYVLVTLPIINYLCVELGYWNFSAASNNSIHLPYNFWFIWVIWWGVVPVYLLQGKFTFGSLVVLVWLDLLFMPHLANLGLLTLNENWILGEILLLIFVLAPALYWAKFSLQNKFVWMRALLQIVVIASIFLVAMPFILGLYGLAELPNFRINFLEFQTIFIVSFPALAAVNDLVTKGKGTPFPYDKTKYLVQTGVYAYCKNPIQWSFTLLFIPLAFFLESPYLLLGSIVSVAYVYGVSDLQENDDMQNRFGDPWRNYNKNTPKWWFLWKPKNIGTGVIYFNQDCSSCNQLRLWFLDSNSKNLEINTANNFIGGNILQVTYIDHNQQEHKSVNAIACAFDHINLAYATLGWFMRLPGINFLLQNIVNTFEFEPKDSSCTINNASPMEKRIRK